MIELKLKIEDIDYDSVADILAPALKDRIDSSEFPAWARLLFLAGGMDGAAFKKILSRVPDDAIDGFVVKLLNEKSEKASQIIEDMAASNGIKIKIADVKATKD